MAQKPFAEIVESSLRSWQVQCWQWDVMPAYGSLVRVESGNITTYGIVHAMRTGPQDGQRTVFAYKKTQTELLRDHPHIFQFLTSTARCLTLGYTTSGTIHYQMAPQPPQIHAFVYHADEKDCNHLFAQEQYLHTLFSHADQLEAPDDLLLALLQHYAPLITHDRLMRIINTFSLLTANDYRRLKLFLQRVQPIMRSQIRSAAQRALTS